MSTPAVEAFEQREAERRRNTGTVLDGTRVTFLRIAFTENIVAETRNVVRTPVRAFAIGDQAVVGKNAIMADPDEPQRDVHVLGWLKPESEGTRWCRGWSERSVKALLAAAALEQSR